MLIIDKGSFVFCICQIVLNIYEIGLYHQAGKYIFSPYDAFYKLRIFSSSPYSLQKLTSVFEVVFHLSFEAVVESNGQVVRALFS